MSMDDAARSSDADQDGAGHSPERRRWLRWPMSPLNTVLVAACAVGAAVCFVLGEPEMTFALLVGAAVGGFGAVFARRGSSGDLERVNALEYADERDRAAGVKGLAAVGVVAMILGAAQVIVQLSVDSDPVARWTSLALFLSLMVSWMIANWYFVRRG